MERERFLHPNQRRRGDVKGGLFRAGQFHPLRGIHRKMRSRGWKGLDQGRRASKEHLLSVTSFPSTYLVPGPVLGVGTPDAVPASPQFSFLVVYCTRCPPLSPELGWRESMWALG